MVEDSRSMQQESSNPRAIPMRSGRQEFPGAVSLPQPGSASKIRNSHLAIDTFSPVNQNGSFEFDRVLKSGSVQKRTRRTKAWKPIYLVLRPNTLSIYRDQQESKLRQKINLSEVTAVARLKDPKQKRQNLFGIFSPARNWHLEADSKKNAQEWVEILRKEARIEEVEEEMMLQSPTGIEASTYGGLENAMNQQRVHEERLGSSSPEPSEPIGRPVGYTRRDPNSVRRPSHTLDYSGNEISDMSDVEPPRTTLKGASAISIPEEPLAVQPPDPPFLKRNGSDMSAGANNLPDNDPERVFWQGHLLLLKSIRGVRQWKDLWVVIRPKTLAIYKDEQEYSPVLILNMSSIIDAVEIDSISRSKTFCMQIITPEKSYKFCAKDEGGYANSLGALKCLIARKRAAA